MCYSLLKPFWGRMPSQHSREGPLPQVILCSNPTVAKRHPLRVSSVHPSPSVPSALPPPPCPHMLGSLLRRCCAPSVPGLELCKEVREVLSGAELPELRANLLLPEDVALRNLPPLRNAHRRLNFEQDRPIFSALEEVSRADPTPRCKLHVSLWGVVCKAEPGLIAV